MKKIYGVSFAFLLLIASSLANAWPSAEDFVTCMLTSKSFETTALDGYIYFSSERVYQYKIEPMGFDFKAEEVETIEVAYQAQNNFKATIALKSGNRAGPRLFYSRGDAEGTNNSGSEGRTNLLRRLIISSAQVEPKDNGVYMVRAPIFYQQMDSSRPYAEMSDDLFYAAECKLKVTLTEVPR